MDCSPPGSSVHGIIPARIVEWVVIFFSRVFLTQGWNLRLLDLLLCGWTFYLLRPQEAPLCLLLMFSLSTVSNSLWPHGTPGFPVLYLLEFAQIHGHWVSDAIQSSHPLLPTSPPALNLSQHQGLFQWVGSFASGGQSIGASASFPLMNIQGWFPLGLTGLILQSKGLSRVFSSTTVRKHQFFRLSLLYGPTLTSIHDCWKNHSFDYMDLCWQSDVSDF